MPKMSPEALYRTVTKSMPGSKVMKKKNLEMIRWGMKLVELADEVGCAAVRKSLDRHASTVASQGGGERDE